MITSADILTDAQVARLAGFKTDTFQRRIKNGFKPGELDLMQAKPWSNGRRRFWFRPDVEKIIKDRIVV